LVIEEPDNGFSLVVQLIVDNLIIMAKKRASYSVDGVCVGPKVMGLVNGCLLMKGGAE